MEDAKLTNLRLAPERIDATLLTTTGRLRHVQIKPGGKLERFGSDGSPGFDGVADDPVLRASSPPRRSGSPAAAPKEHGVPDLELQYAVPHDSSGKTRWVVYFTRGRYVIGDARGRFERVLP